MKCKGCGVNKLSNEFPDEPLSETCCHALSFCMRCVIDNVKHNRTCPACQAIVDPDSPEMKFMQATLDTMFEDLSKEDEEAEEKPLGSLTVMMLSGEKLDISYRSLMTVLDLKLEIFQEWKYDIRKQKLLHKEKELKSNLAGYNATLQRCGVQDGDSIYLVILLYSVPQGLNETVFDLSWGYPPTGKDALDASCLIFDKERVLGVVDYRHKSYEDTVIVHSGDIMDDEKKIGHHTITVNIEQIPSTITHLFFTLSAWKSPNISKFPNPSLAFYEKSKPHTNLCKTRFKHAKNSQAVIMCFMAQNSDGVWCIYNSFNPTKGNAENYPPLITSIHEIIRKGF